MIIGGDKVPVPFTPVQQEELREQLFHEGIRLCRTLGVQRMTVARLTQACGIAKGSFYSFFESKEAFILSLIDYADQKAEEMLLNKLAGRAKMSVHEFFEFFREYLHSDYDLMNGLKIDDFLWLRTHMKDENLFDPRNQMETAGSWLSLIGDMRRDVDSGTVVNLIKSIYAMREHRDTMVEASLENSIEMILQMLENYLTGSFSPLPPFCIQYRSP